MMTRRKSLKRQINEGDPRKRGIHKLQEELQSEPMAAHGLPQCPRHLKGRARATWYFLREELEVMNLDCRPDALALEGACTSYALAAAAEEIIAKTGLQIEEPIFHRGQKIGVERKNNPVLRTRNQAWARFLQFADRFGLSPQARQSLAIDKPADADKELHALLSRPRLTDDNKAKIQGERPQ